MITVRLPEPLQDGHGAFFSMNAVPTLGELIDQLDLGERDELFNFAVNGELVLHGERAVALRDGDEVEVVVAFSGG